MAAFAAISLAVQAKWSLPKSGTLPGLLGRSWACGRCTYTTLSGSCASPFLSRMATGCLPEAGLLSAGRLRCALDRK